MSQATDINEPKYDTSRIFAPFTSGRELYNVVQILKRIGQIAIGEADYQASQT